MVGLGRSLVLSAIYNPSLYVDTYFLGSYSYNLLGLKTNTNYERGCVEIIFPYGTATKIKWRKKYGDNSWSEWIDI